MLSLLLSPHLSTRESQQGGWLIEESYEGGVTTGNHAQRACLPRFQGP